MAANLRVKRVAALVSAVPSLRVKRVAALVAAVNPNLRVKRVAALVVAPTANVRVKRVTALVGAPTSFPLSVTVAPALGSAPALPFQSLTLTAVATPASGDGVSSYLWTPANADTPPVDSPGAATTRVRVPMKDTSKTLVWNLRVISANLVTVVYQVTVAANRAPFTVDLSGNKHPWFPVGKSPSLYPPPAKANAVNLRVRGVVGLITTPDVAPPVTPTVLIGARFRYPQTSGATTIAQDFAAGEASLGAPIQISKDFDSGSLNPSYVSPYPSRVRVLLSLSNTVDYVNDPNFASYIRSLPTGTILTYQHEPERPIFTWTGPQYVATLNDFRAKVRAIRTDIPVWMVSSGSNYRPSGNAVDGSYMNGLTVDGYAIDTYRTAQANASATDPLSTLASPLSAQQAIQNRVEFQTWRKFIPTGKPFGIGEYGDGWDHPQFDASVIDSATGQPQQGSILQSTVWANRMADVQSSISWLQANGGSFLIYWFSEGGAGGAVQAQVYRPTDPAFISMYGGLPRATSNPLLPSGGSPTSNDALVSRSLSQLSVFSNWCRSNGVRGVIGETGGMNGNDAANQALWNNLVSAYYGAANAAGLGVLQWAAGRVFSSSDPQVVWCSPAGQYGANLSSEQPNSAPLRAVAGLTSPQNGINVSGGEFFGPTPSGAANLNNGTKYSNINPGVHNTDFAYPTLADFQTLAAAGIKLVRLPFTWERIQPTLGGALDANHVSLLQGVLNDANTAGLSVVLDCHNYGGYTIGTSTTAATTSWLGPATGTTVTHAHLANLWTRIVAAFGTQANLVALDIMNEPGIQDNASSYANPTQAVANLKTLMQTVFSAIVGAGWTKDVWVSGWYGAPPYDWVNKIGSKPFITGTGAAQCVYTAHQYFDGSSDYGAYSGTYHATPGPYTYQTELASVTV